MRGDEDLTSLRMFSRWSRKLEMPGMHEEDKLLALLIWQHDEIWNVRRETKKGNILRIYPDFAFRGCMGRISIWHTSTYLKRLEGISFIIVLEKCCHLLLSQEYCIWNIPSFCTSSDSPENPPKPFSILKSSAPIDNRKNEEDEGKKTFHCARFAFIYMCKERRNTMRWKAITNERGVGGGRQGISSFF